MPKKPTRIQTTEAQRDTLSKIQKNLAEKGYLISPVAYWYRKHGREFLALPKDDPQKFVLVRPQRNGSVLIRPFCSPATYSTVRAIVTKFRKEGLRVEWRSQQLRYAIAREDWWLEFIPRAMRKELLPFVFASSVEAKPPLV